MGEGEERGENVDIYPSGKIQLTCNSMLAKFEFENLKWRLS